jgi:hypothetical protein
MFKKFENHRNFLLKWHKNFVKYTTWSWTQVLRIGNEVHILDYRNAYGYLTLNGYIFFPLNFLIFFEKKEFLLFKKNVYSIVLSKINT